MIYRLALLLFCLLITPSFSEEPDLLPSTPDQIATLTSDPNSLIGGLVNPLSGQLALRQKDLIAKGAQEIVLTRTYIPPSIPCFFPKHKHNQKEWDKKALYHHLIHSYIGWVYFPYLRLQLIPKSMQVRFSDPSGVNLHFQLSGPDYSIATLASDPYALSNLSGDRPSGSYDFRNTQISYQENGERITIHAIDGARRCYRKRGFATKTSYLHLLEKEILPNGKILKYHYNEQLEPTHIESLDPQERYVYASMRITGSPPHGLCRFTSSTGLSADYTFYRRPLHVYIKEHHLKEEYNFTCPPILTSVKSPFYAHETIDYCDHFILGNYSGREQIFGTEQGGFGDPPHYKVHKVFLPVGAQDQFQTVYEITYNPPIPGQREGSTTVKNSDGTSTTTYFSKNLLTTAIHHFGQDGTLRKEKLFTWHGNQWLQSIEIRDGEHNLLHRKSYAHDRFGNPILELFTGDLTGEGTHESFAIRRTFSDDGRHLLLREEDDDGRVTCFSYLPHTNLITSKLTKEGDRILLREFSLYDDSNNLIQTISDDGTSDDRENLSHVTQRRLTTYRLRPSAPFLHMPEWIEESYWEAGTEKPLQKSHLIYDQHGHIVQEEVYDAGGALAYTLHKTYNERGDLLSETNRLGQRAVYTYDARGRPETSTNFSNRVHKTFHHDRKGRLRARIEKGEDGVVHASSSEYDFYDRKIQKSDSFQNTTRYTHDPLVGEITRSDFPPIASLDGQAIPVSTSSTYDALGRELTQTDANGHTTIYRYNAYSSPTEILHPNGGREIFRYAKNGRLAHHTDLDGLTIHYKRDVLGRVLSKTYGDSLAEELFTYSGFNLLTETDREGHVKTYTYDGAGRKIREEFCGHVTEWIYDSLGRLATICKHNGENTLLIHYKRDLEDQILEEYQTDLSGRLLYRITYSYDGDSNRKTITRYINGKEAIDTFTFDSFRRLIEERDAEGYSHKTVYDETYTNALGQRVLQTITTDPLQITTVETKDALARTIKTEILNPQGATLSCQEMFHDPQGNLLYRKDHLYENDHFRTTQTINYTYTPDNQIESLTRAFATQDARTTTYTYSPAGKMVTKTLPDGVTLTYSYHPLGFMSRLDSSDGVIRHAFEYTLSGHLIYALDENQKSAIKREVDPFGNMIQEVFPHGLEVKKEYDDFNRLLALKMATQGEVLYTYDPLFLRQVTRTSQKGDVLYTHTYEEYDEDGNLVTESLMGGLGRVTHATDLRGYKASISSPYFSQKCSYDQVGNLISSSTDGMEHLYSYDGLSQLSSESPSQTYIHNSLHNRIQKNGETHEVNDLNELLSTESTRCSYDLNGNQILRERPSETSHFTYDPLHRLIEVASEQKRVHLVYDPIGRRLSKRVYTPTADGWEEEVHERYLYHGQNEIGAISHEEPKNLRVLGLAQHREYPITIGVELEGQIFAPLLDVQGNIRRLVNLDSRTVKSSYEFTAFGEELQAHSSADLFNPWRFASKRFDSELNLIYFGKRYYDPGYARWLTTDPAGFIDSANLYQYVLNNPFRYVDPDGQFAWAIPLVIWGLEVVFPSLSAVAAQAIYATLGAAIVYGGYQAVAALNRMGAFSDVLEPGDFYWARKDVEFDKLKKRQVMFRKKQGRIDPDPKRPESLEENPDWQETTHPDQGKAGHREFENVKTGEKIRFDKGEPGRSGHSGHDHHHHLKPDPDTGEYNYLDDSGKAVPRGSDDAHLYNPENAWWN